jgi:hypothetical protein
MNGNKAKNLSEIAGVLVRFDHVARFIVNVNHGVRSLRAVSVNRMLCSRFSLESRIRISPERKLARVRA